MKALKLFFSDQFYLEDNCKVKQIIYNMLSFYFEFPGTFPIVKSNCLQRCVKVFNKSIY